MAFDSLVSIGGQSLLDGVWRILQPALQSLSNPLPISLPGMTNAWVRIRKMTPSLSGLPLGLRLDVDVEVLGDLLLTASVKSGNVSLALPVGNIKIPPVGAPDLQGDLHLPNTPIQVTLPKMKGPVPLPTGSVDITLSPEPPNATGSMSLPTGGTFDLPALTGTLTFVGGSLNNVGLALPSVVPLAVNLTPANPAQVPVTLALSAAPIDQASEFGLLLVLGTPVVGSITSLPAPGIYATAITEGLRRLLPQLGVQLPVPINSEPFVGVGPTLAEIGNTASNIATAAQAAIEGVVNAALAGLTARTGRLIFPMPAAGSPCDVALLPTAAQARVVLSANGPVLQVGSLRTGVSSTPFTFFPFTPSAAAEVEVRIGNRFLRDLLCCLIEKLPNFTFLTPAAPSGRVPRICCTWPLVRLELGPLVLTGFLELCIVGPPGTPKTIELRGFFAQSNAFFRIVAVSFTLTLNLQLNDVAAITGLRLVSASVIPDVQLQPSVWVLLAVAAALNLPGMAILIIGLPVLLISFIREQLSVVVETLLSRAHALTSPVAVPPGLFEAFGPLVPASLTIDDLIAAGVLATPTSPWALLPISPPKLPTEPPTTPPTEPVD